MLRQRSFHQGVHILRGVPHGAQAVWHVNLLEKVQYGVGQEVAGVFRTRMRYVGSHQLRRVQVTFRVCGRGESENRGRVQDDGHAVGYQRLAFGVALGHVVTHVARHGIRHAVRQMAARVAEANTGEGRREHHLASGVLIVGVVGGPDQVVGDHLDGARRPDVADRIGALIRGTEAWVLRRVALAEGQGGVGLEAVAEHVEPTARDDHPGKGPCVIRVDETHDGPQRAVRNSGLGLHLQKVEDGHARRFAARAGRRWYRDQWLERAGNGTPLADGRVDVGEEVRGVGRVKVGGLGRVDARAAADCHVAVEAAVGRERYGVFEGHVRRLHMHAVEQHRIDALIFQGRERYGDGVVPGHARVGDDHHAPGAQALHLVAYLSRHAGPELDARGRYGERGLQCAAAHAIPLCVDGLCRVFYHAARWTRGPYNWTNRRRWPVPLSSMRAPVFASAPGFGLATADGI